MAGVQDQTTRPILCGAGMGRCRWVCLGEMERASFPGWPDKLSQTPPAASPGEFTCSRTRAPSPRHEPLMTMTGRSGAGELALGACPSLPGVALHPASSCCPPPGVRPARMGCPDSLQALTSSRLARFLARRAFLKRIPCILPQGLFCSKKSYSNSSSQPGREGAASLRG